jgi:predicted transposase/invertase (TIGR01784 family)
MNKSTKNHNMETNKEQPLIRFDWAMKRLLRQKANYTILEGFLSALLNKSIKIINIKDSESNKDSATSKYNRVDIFVEDSNGELLIIEVQISDKVDYFLRMLYGVSKAITEHIKKGDPYSKVRKIYHINIIYFELGQGEDYVYHGCTEFHGIHKNDKLELTEEQKDFFALENNIKADKVRDLYPEYYILCVENFNEVAKEGSLDEWLYYLKNDTIPATFKAPGLKEARKQLKYDKLSKQEKIDYDVHIDQKLQERSSIDTATFKGVRKGKAIGKAEGLAKGEAIGLKKGKAIGKAEGLQKGEVIGMKKGKAIGKAEGEALGRAATQEHTILNSHRAGLPIPTIAAITGLTQEQITQILNKHLTKPF